MNLSKLIDISLSKLQEMVKDEEAWCAAVPGLQGVEHDLATKQQQTVLLNSRLDLSRYPLISS